MDEKTLCPANWIKILKRIKSLEENVASYKPFFNKRTNDLNNVQKRIDNLNKKIDELEDIITHMEFDEELRRFGYSDSEIRSLRTSLIKE